MPYSISDESMECENVNLQLFLDVLHDKHLFFIQFRV